MEPKSVIDLLDIINKFYREPDIQKRMDIFAQGIHLLGWGRVHIYIFDTDTHEIRSAAYCGLTDEEIAYLEKNRMDYDAAQKIIAPSSDKFRIGIGYYFPYGEADEAIEQIRQVGSKSSKDPSEYKGWHPQDLMYFPLTNHQNQVVGLVSVDDPQFKIKPTEETLEPVEKFIDIVFKRLEEKELQAFFDKSQDFLSRLFFVSPAAIIFSDEEDNIIDLNPATEEIFGYEKFELLCKPSSLIYSGQDQFQMVKKKRLKNDIFRGEANLLKKNGEKFFGYMVSVPVTDEGKNIEGYLDLILDMTEEKNLQHYLIRAEKMAGIGILASGIAHELNNPLYGILGLAETIVEEDDMDNIKEYASDIVRYSKEAAGIIRDLSGYSYSSRSETSSTVDINSTIEKAIQMMRRLDKLSQVSIVTELEQIPEFNASAGELQQIFINMITNACHAMKSTPRKVLTIKTQLRGDFAMISFEDTGIGISAEQKAKIFEPFYTTKELGKGTGLGLYICYRIATKYFGRIDVESEKGKGTKFTIVLPLRRRF
ncbi:MAG: two-component system sensor histidine kinase NtrB [Candidatus Zixiibacteriota bacterium]